MHTNDPHVREISEAIAQKRLVPVVGAGVSAWTAHIPGWTDLVKKGLDYVEGLGTHSREEIDAARQLLKNGDTIRAAKQLKLFLRAPGGEYARWLRQTFRIAPEQVESDRLVLAIRRLRCRMITTTNYDKLLSELRPDYLKMDAATWRNPSGMYDALSEVSEGRAVLHLHGVYDEPESVVFGEDDYEVVVQRAPAYRDILKTLWLDRTLLFIGCSFKGIEDPDFIHLLKWSAETFPASTHKHYALLRNGSFKPEDVARFLHDWRIQIVSYGDTHDDLAPFIERLSGDETKPPSIPCPYPGMVPLKSEDAGLLFGRSAEVMQLIRCMRNLQALQRLIVITGPSGSGKSSLVCAGLLPALPSASYWPNASWRVPPPVRPGGRPIDALVDAVGAGEWRSSVNSMDVSTLAQMVSASMAVLPPLPDDHQGSTSTHSQQLLVVDQFEEMFAEADPQEQRRFIAVLKALCALENHWIVITLRDDFYQELLTSDLSSLSSAQYLKLKPLGAEALREVIVQPAERVEVTVEPDLVERLLADAATDEADVIGRLPLLQETLVLLWDHMESRKLTLHAYKRLGGEGRTGISVALAEKADSVLAGFSESQRVLTQRIFLRLIAFGQGRPHTRRQQPLATLRVPADDPTMFAATLEALTRGRLLTLSGRETDADRQVDMAHEALITGWNTLRDWISECREAEQARRRFEDKAAEWESWVKRGRPTIGLLYEDELAEADRWLGIFGKTGLGCSSTLNDLIQASRVAIQKAKEQKELDRKREVERTMRGRLVAVMAVALLVTGYLAVVIQQQNTQLVHQTLIVRAQALAASSVSQLEVDPERSLLLAMEAVSTTRRTGQPVVRQAHEVLDQALVRSRVRYRWEAHDHAVTSVAYSPDGKQLVTSSTSRDKDRNVYVWDASGQLMSTLQGHTDSVNSVAFSTDGKQLVTTSDDMKVIVWGAGGSEGSDGADKWQPTTTITLTGGTSQVLDATFSPDGKSIVVASRDSQARIWSTIESRWVVTFTGHTERVTSASYSPDGQHVVTASWDDTVRVWDVITGADVITTSRHILKGHTARVTSARYSPDGRTIVSSSEDETVRIWDAQTGGQLRILQGHGAWVYDASYSPDGRTIVTASGDRTARVWDAGSGEERFPLRGHTDVVSSARYSPDGRSIVTVSHDRAVRVWDARDELAWILSAVYDKDGRLILSAASDRTAKVWNAKTEQPVITLTGHTDFLYSALFSPDERYIVTASADKTAKVWDIADHIAKVLDIEAQSMGVVLSQPWITITHGEAVTDAAYSPSGKRIVTASNDHTAKVWDVTSVSAGDILTQPMMTLTHGRFDVTSATYSPDGRHIVTTSKDKVARIWNAPTGSVLDATTPKTVITLKGDEGHEDWVFDAAYSPDGKHIVTGSSDRTAKIWDASNGRLVRTLRGHEHQVRRVAYSSDGNFIVTASWDATVKIWRAQDGQIVRTLRGHGNRVMGATFKNDGSTIVTAGDDGTMHQHPVSIDDLLALAESRVTRSLSDEERSTYLVEP